MKIIKLFWYIINFVLVFVAILAMAKAFNIDWQAALILFGFGVLYAFIISITYGGK